MGYEKTLSAYMGVAAGGNMPMGSGHHDNAQIMCHKTLVLDNEIWKIVLRAIDGFNLDDEAFALNVINEVGPGGNYLTHPHTRKNLRKEQYIPEITDRSVRRMWETTGSKSILQRAKEKAERIVQKHSCNPLEPTLQRELGEIVRQAEKRPSVET
jgi:trimethylamine--corrinoid protein Co-methyltransferase